MQWILSCLSNFSDLSWISQRNESSNHNKRSAICLAPFSFNTCIINREIFDIFCTERVKCHSEKAVIFAEGCWCLNLYCTLAFPYRFWRASCWYFISFNFEYSYFMARTNKEIWLVCLLKKNKDEHHRLNVIFK